MYQHTSSTPSNLTYTNGNLPKTAATFTNDSAISSDSESELSDPTDPPSSTAMPPHTATLNHSVSSIEQGFGDKDLTSEDALGSDDGDYDMDDSPQPAANVSPSPSSHHSTETLGKRKAEADEDDYMLNNPELYGLRRSVRRLSLCPYEHQH